MSRPILVSDFSGMTCIGYRVERTWIVAEALGAPPVSLLSNPSCGRCYDMPPPGFACNDCGAKAPTPELPSAAQLLASRTP
jgi:hypothetical protein